MTWSIALEVLREAPWKVHRVRLGQSLGAGKSHEEPHTFWSSHRTRLEGSSPHQLLRSLWMPSNALMVGLRFCPWVESTKHHLQLRGAQQPAVLLKLLKKTLQTNAPKK